MEPNPFAPEFDDLPETIAIFPLAGVLLLPCGQLPLNIFEPRYLSMVEDAMAADRYIGMVQPRDKTIREIVDNTPVFETGCAGKITAFNETEEGKYLITLTGICRFNITEEVSGNRNYRRVRTQWTSYREDLQEKKCLDLNRTQLKTLLKKYFELQDMDCDWEAIDGAPDGRLITCLSMICPFDAGEKQALLEAKCCHTRAELFMTMLEIAACEKEDCCSHH
ncbi:MAG: ATP-dependent protease [Micavibrio sp.]|nr:MAG: ATP-dependent protease [Micavibrio sp.]